MTWKGWLASSLAVIHFSLVGLVLVGNWQRSGVQDSIVTLGHPYLVGLNWHVELLSIDWNRANLATLRYRIVAQDAQSTDTLLHSDSKDWDRDRNHQFLRIIVSFLEADDQDSSARMLHSIAMHREKVTGKPITRMTVQKQEGRDSRWENIFDANIVRLNEREFGLVPVIDPQRSVRTLKGPASSAPKQ